MNRIEYNGNWEIIEDSVEDANYLFNSELFFEKILAKDSFDNSNADGSKIVELIKNCTVKASLEFYKPLPIPPWSRANAYTKRSAPSTIFLNRRKLRNRSIESIAATIVHEYMHLVDFASDGYEFGHGDNDSAGKSNTVPYWIDQLAYNLLTGKVAKLVLQCDESK